MEIFRSKSKHSKKDKIETSKKKENRFIIELPKVEKDLRDQIIK